MDKYIAPIITGLIFGAILCAIFIAYGEWRDDSMPYHCEIYERENVTIIYCGVHMLSVGDGRISDE